MLKEFTTLVNVKDLDLDDAMRVYLSYFSMPGEAQQIERVVTAFTAEYCIQNPTKLCPDSSYLLCYSLMMLQTSLHNPNVQEKMTLEKFANLTKPIKIYNKDPLPEPYVAKLFNSVREIPLSVHFKYKKQLDL